MRSYREVGQSEQNLNNKTKMRIIQGAAEVAGITFGRDVIVEF